ncbi:hypothetical protein IFR04_004402 [Cadophora malorum]|uniref:Uncharacterized protein n=1 Tax=Cadophora malorum TaxID=108018 RepID=A0A8H7WCU9_9HELO|nr:hypothetical protein IFR04_004402 [Cadophora malorum]
MKYPRKGSKHTLTSIRQTSSSSKSSHLSQLSQPSRIFPAKFGFYSTSLSDIFIALSSKSSYLYYISISSPPILLSNTKAIKKLDTTLYASPSPSPETKQKLFSPLASAQFAGPSETPYITLGTLDFGAAPTEKLESEGFSGFRDTTHFFSLYLPLSGARERFEWEVSGGREVRELGHARGDEVSEGEEWEGRGCICECEHGFEEEGEDEISDEEASEYEFGFVCNVLLKWKGEKKPER